MNYFEKLEREFNLYYPKNWSHSNVFRGTDLLKDEGLESLLHILGSSIQSPSRLVSASLFAKYYSYLVFSGPLYVMSHYNEPMDVSLDRISLITTEKWQPILQFNEPYTPIQNRIARSEWRDQVIESVFKYNLKPIYELLTKLTKIDQDTLWAHVSYSVHWAYDEWIESAVDNVVKEQLKEDFNYLTKAAPGHLFGMEGMNPLDIKFTLIDHPIFPNKKFRLRKKCCLRYKLPDAINCTTCPCIDEDRRKQLLMAYFSAKS